MSRSDHVFARVPSVQIERSSFDRSHGHKTTLDAGYLVPIFVDEVLPGDTFNLEMTGFGRLATPIFPIMDNAYLESHWFFVPTRLIWSNFQKFHGEQTDPGDPTDFLVPQLDVGSAASGSLHDYFGMPNVGASMLVNALPFRAYNLIWNQWFRDENLQDSVTVPLDDGPDGSVYTLLRRGKRHDYFTSCLPWPQKGDAVSLPLTGDAPVITGAEHATLTGSAMTMRTSAGGQVGGGTPFGADAAGSAFTGGTLSGGIVFTPVSSLHPSNLYANLSAVTAATINELRQAFQIQRLLERDARGGTRYTEIVRSHFGVVSPDARLQRPEYLGGGSSPLIVSQVPQTSSTGATGTPQGNLAAYGTVTARNHGFVQSFTEHGYIIGLVSVRADMTYSQGVERFWHRRTRYDFYYPALSHLGEQAVLNKEIFAVGGATTDDLVFGYQERYAEYRYKPSRLSGLMRVGRAAEAWHLGQEFAALPVLDSDFIQEDPPFDRVIAVPTEPHFILDTHISLRCARPMPVFGVPGLIDHF